MSMRYIRTKDGRILDVKKYIHDRTFHWYRERIGFHYFCWKDEFDGIPDCLGKMMVEQLDKNECKQANTVEELCDKYYGVEENGDVEKVFNWSKDAYPIKPHEWAVEGFCTKEDITIDELKNRFPKGIFGATVWFDSKGNLHIDIVAKMNDKGDLELL